MNRQELMQKVIELKKEYRFQVLVQETFPYLPVNEQILKDFERTRQKGEKWHQFVRFTLSDPEERIYMYQRLLRLVQKHDTLSQYFRIKSEFGQYQIPDRVADLNRLQMIFKDYFDIYKTIIRRIHFDYPIQRKTSSFIQGKVNWDRTIRNSTTKFPLEFDVSYWKREFVTPGNILLVLAAIWLNKESYRLFQTKFDEPLNEREKLILNLIFENTQKIIKTFPYQQVLALAKRYSHFSYDDRRILELERKSFARIKDGIVQNKKYYDLLLWIKKFRELNIRLASKHTTNFPLETLKNLDTISEAWLFFEMIEYFYEQGILLGVDLKENSFTIKVLG